MQADILTKVILPLSLSLIMFGIGLSLRLSDFIRVFKAPKAIAVGLTGQMILLPAIAFALEGVEPQRPLTHDLLKLAIEALDSRVDRVDTFPWEGSANWTDFEIGRS